VTRARTWSLSRWLEWARRLGASPPKRMTASWFGSRVGPPNTRLRRDLRALWRAPLGSLAISQATPAQPPRPKPWRPAHTLRNGPIPFRYVTENRARQQVANPLASSPSATPNDKLDIAPAARPNNRHPRVVTVGWRTDAPDLSAGTTPRQGWSRCRPSMSPGTTRCPTACAMVPPCGYGRD
jgi:hypothetical protein